MIMRSLLRLCVVRALRDHTLAADRVFNSEIGQLNATRLPTRDPFIAIYTDAASYTGSSFGLLSPEGTVTLVVECVCPGPADGISDADAGLELSCDLLERQVRVALSDPSDWWTEQLLTFADFDEVEVLRGSSDGDDGVRFVARQMSIKCRLMFEPTPGQPAPLFERIIARLEVEDDPESAVYVGVFRKALQTTSPHWAQTAAQLGFSGEDVDLLGVADNPEAPLRENALLAIEQAADE